MNATSSRNRRHRRRLERQEWWRVATTLGRWAGIGSAVCLIAMALVYVRNQQVLAGQRIRDREQRIAALRQEIEGHEIAILRLQERSALRQRLDAIAGPDAFVEINPAQGDFVLFHEPDSERSP